MVKIKEWHIAAVVLTAGGIIVGHHLLTRGTKGPVLGRQGHVRRAKARGMHTINDSTFGAPERRRKSSFF